MRLDMRLLSAVMLGAAALLTLSCQGSADPTATPSPGSAIPTSTPVTATATPSANINCGGPDTDSDGLADCYENAIGTSVYDKDTDGDALSDYEEVVNKAFDAQANNFQFNPLIADMPSITFELTSVPEISVNYTTTDSQSHEVTNTEDEETASQVVTSNTSEESESFEAGGELFPKGSVSVTNSWTKEQVQENRKAYSRAVSETSSRSIESTGGEMAVTLKVRNSGFQTVTLQSLTIAALQSSSRGESSLTPIGNLQFDGEFSPLEIAPNNATVAPLIFSRDLSLGKALDLLADSGSIVLQASAWQATDPDGRSFTHNLTDILSKDALVTIDYGPRVEKETGRAKETYYISTVADFDAKSVSVGDALGKILRIPFTTGTAAWGVNGGAASTEDGLLSVRNVGTDPAVRGHWVAVLGSLSDNGATQNVEVLDNLEKGYDFSNIELRKGSSLLLTYVEDADGDGVFSREEFSNGTSDQDADTDDDGLTDFEEIRQGWAIPVTRTIARKVFSDPLYPDLDEDGVLDSAERAGTTDPNSRDTDGDGVRDGDDTPLVAEDMYELAHFAFDGDLLNAVSGPATAVMEGDTYGLDRTGAANGSLYLDGLWNGTPQASPGSSVTLKDLLAESPERGMAYSFWMRPEELRAQGILYSGPSNSAERSVLWSLDSGALFLLATADGRHILSSYDPPNEAGEWVFVTVVFSDEDNVAGAERVSLYVDGLLVGSVVDSREPVVTVDPGDWVFGVGEPLPDGSVKDSFAGWIDDFRVFDRSLSADEVQALYEEQVE